MRGESEKDSYLQQLVEWKGQVEVRERGQLQGTVNLPLQNGVKKVLKTSLRQAKREAKVLKTIDKTIC